MSHQVSWFAFGPLVTRLPPRPSMAPAPTMPLPAVSRATISALHDLSLLVVAVPQVPRPLS